MKKIFKYKRNDLEKILPTKSMVFLIDNKYYLFLKTKEEEVKYICIEKTTFKKIDNRSSFLRSIREDIMEYYLPDINLTNEQNI